MTNQIDVLKYFGECTAYSAKGHYKSADLRRIFIYFLVLINLLFSVFAITNIFSETTLQILGAISIIAACFILIYQSKDEADYISSSMKTGDEYLRLHNDIFVLFSTREITLEIIDEIKEKVNQLNSKTKPSISFVAKYWAKYAIEKSKEMNIWWKN